MHQTLSKFDIGLAIEPGKDFNNELALSNKLFAYLQSGLFVLATDTIEQDRFIKGTIISGMTINKKFIDLEEKLLQLYLNRHTIRSQNLERFHHAKMFSWENLNSALITAWSN